MSQTVQCPQCRRSVRISEQAAGKRVACPSCSKEFLAPGFQSNQNDDDDWLTLDTDEPKPSVPVASPSRETTSVAPQRSSSEPEQPQPKPPTARPEASASSAPAAGKPNVPTGIPVGKPVAQPPSLGIPQLSGADEAALAEFMDADDLLPPGPAPTAGVPTASGDDPFADLPDIPPPPKTAVSASVPATPPTAATAQPVEYETEYRVRCKVCDTILYAKATQAGKQITCSDCHSPVTVPPPPRKKVKPKVNIENAKVMPLEQPKVAERKDPFLKSAEELLRDAENTEADDPPPDYDTPDMKEWAMKVFGIFLDPGVVVHWIILATMASVPAYFAVSWSHPILTIALMVGAFFFAALSVSCAFAIMLSASNDEKQVTEWPETDPIGWMGQLVLALAAAALAAIPAYMLARLGFGDGLFTIFVTMLSIYALMPFFLLSMLDMGNIFTPFSPEVARSTTRCQEAWGGFYFSSGLIFAALYMLFIMLSSSEATAASVVIGIFAGVAVLFIYFSMLGRLAYAIGHAVDDPRHEAQSTDSATPSA